MNNLPAVNCVVVRSFIDGAIDPVYWVVSAFLIWVFKLLYLQLVGHKCVGHHAVHQEHERRSRSVHKGTQTAHHHHRCISPGGKPKLEKGINSFINYFNKAQAELQKLCLSETFN